MFFLHAFLCTTWLHVWLVTMEVRRHGSLRTVITGSSKPPCGTGNWTCVLRKSTCAQLSCLSRPWTIYTFWKGNFTTLLSLVWTSIELNSMPKLPPALCNYISSIVSALGKSRPYIVKPLTVLLSFFFFSKEKVGLGRWVRGSSFRGQKFGSQHPPQAAHNQLQLQRPYFWPLQARVLICTYHSLLCLACLREVSS